MENVSVNTTARAEKAASVYSKLLLSFYDLYVFKCVSPVFFQCPEKRVVDFYLQNVSKSHLEVGVGTGYLLKKCSEEGKLSNISLLDLNENCLQMTKEKLKPLSSNTYKANILEPLPFEGQIFDSIGLNFVLHCVPGNFKEKGMALVNLSKHLREDGVIFGSTAIYDLNQNFMAKLVMDAYNKSGIFNNKADVRNDLAELLASNFDNVMLEQVGNVLFFKASRKKS